MKIRSLFCFPALLLACAIADQALAASAPPQRVVITPASFSEREGVLVVAHHQGFFRKYNLDAQLVLMPNAPLALSALTAGDSQFYYGTTSGASLGAVLNGLDGVFVAAFINRLVGAFAVGRHQNARRFEREEDRRGEPRRRQLDVHHAGLRTLGHRP